MPTAARAARAAQTRPVNTLATENSTSARFSGGITKPWMAPQNGELAPAPQAVISRESRWPVESHEVTDRAKNPKHDKASQQQNRSIDLTTLVSERPVSVNEQTATVRQAMFPGAEDIPILQQTTLTCVADNNDRGSEPAPVESDLAPEDPRSPEVSFHTPEEGISPPTGDANVAAQQSPPRGSARSERSLTPDGRPRKRHAKDRGLNFDLITKLRHRKRQVKSEHGDHDLERQRLQLLREACVVSDQEFLFLHQLYCWASLHNGLGTCVSLSGVSQQHSNGLNILLQFLSPNDDIAKAGIEWFSDFPEPLSSLSKRTDDHSFVHSRVLPCLAKLAAGWQDIQLAYMRSQAPPSSADIERLLGIKSKLLQHTVFLGFLRTLWVGEQDDCMQQCEDAFIKSQVSDDPEMIESDSQILKQILATHQEHALPKSPSSPEPAEDFSPADTAMTHNNPLGQTPLSTSQQSSELSDANPAPNSMLGQASDVGRVHVAHVETLEQPDSEGQEPQIPTTLNMMTSPKAHETTVSRTTSSPPAPQLEIAPMRHATPTAQQTGATVSTANTGPLEQSRPTVRQVQQAEEPVSSERRVQKLGGVEPHSPTTVLQSAAPTGLTGVNESPTATIGPDLDSRSRPPQPAPQIAPTASAHPRPQIHTTQHPGTNDHHSSVNVNGESRAISEIDSWLRSPSQSLIAPPPSTPGIQTSTPQDLPSAVNHGVPALFQSRSSQVTDIASSSLAATSRAILPSSIYQPSTAYQQFPSHQPSSTYQPLQNHWFGQNGVPTPPHHVHLAAGVSSRQAMGAVITPQIMSPSTFGVPRISPRKTTIAPIVYDQKQSAGKLLLIPYVFKVGGQGLTQNGPYVETFIKFDSRLIQSKPDVSTIQLAMPLQIRMVKLGSVLVRLRSIKLQSSGPLPPPEAWVTMDTCWPKFVALSVNGYDLEPERSPGPEKKDLPIDITSLVIEGRNSIKAGVINWGVDDSHQYRILAETLYVGDITSFKSLIKQLHREVARARIVSRLKSSDAEIEITQSTIILNVTDPFTSRLHTSLPVRGRSCKHDQCFDLDTFLNTRSVVDGIPHYAHHPNIPFDLKTPVPPEELCCPICKADVRPQFLIVDQFMYGIRDQLVAWGREDVKAVLVKDDGSWEIIEEEKTRAESESIRHSPHQHGTAISNASNLAHSARADTHPDTVEISDDE